MQYFVFSEGCPRGFLGVSGVHVDEGCRESIWLRCVDIVCR